MLGAAIGAEARRPQGDGAPDVVWTFAGDTHVALEAKSEMGEDAVIPKSGVLQAKGHRDWVLENYAEDRNTAEVHVVLVGPTRKVHEAGKPHAVGVGYRSLADVSQMTEDALEMVGRIRTECLGMGYLACRGEVERIVRDAGLHVESILALMQEDPLG